MKLTVKDRIEISALYPKTGDLVTLTLLEDIGEKVKLSQEEIKEINLRIEGTSYAWNKESDKEVEFTELELGVLQKTITDWDKKKEIPIGLGRLCKKFMEAKKDEKPAESKEPKK